MKAISSAGTLAADGREKQKPVDDLCMGRRDLLWIVRWKDLWTVAQQVFKQDGFFLSNQPLVNLTLEISTGLFTVFVRNFC